MANWNVIIEGKGLKKQTIISNAMTAEGAKVEVKKSHPESTILKITRGSDKAIDKAIKMMDANPNQDVQELRRTLKGYQTPYLMKMAKSAGIYEGNESREELIRKLVTYKLGK